MMPPACLKCNQKMEKVQIGANVAIFTKLLGNQRPYEVWSADVHQCNHCGVKIVCQSGRDPFWRHFHTEPVPTIDYPIWER